MELSDSGYTFLERILRCKSLRVCEDDLSPLECQAFWTSEEVVAWFEARGYTPYEPNHEKFLPIPSLSITSPRLPYENYQEADYPYAYHDAQPESDIAPSLSAKDATGRIMYAQDRRLRHVAIKVLHIESAEYRVVHFLSQQSQETMRENCLLPVIELLYCRNACFVVMPRWGGAAFLPQFHTIRDLLFIMKSLLKALAFLHSHNILHRDISPANTLVNHFGMPAVMYLDTRVPQILDGLLIYALIDFDLSMMLPQSTDRTTYRLPFEYALSGSGGPCDIDQGEFDYNPFAYDVGCLGVMFCEHYQHHTKDMPQLAVLFDKMVARNISQRFTAEEALRFVDKVMMEAEPAQLAIPERPNPDFGCYYELYDRWEGLPLEFQKEMAAYREPVGVPLVSRVLRAIVNSTLLPRWTVPTIRRFFYRITLLPRMVGTQLSKYFY